MSKKTENKREFKKKYIIIKHAEIEYIKQKNDVKI